MNHQDTKTSSLTKIPRLKSGNDAKVAAALAEVIKDAKEAVRRIVKAGFLLEYIALDLERGELEPWLDAHLDGFSRSSFFAWRRLAKNLMEEINLKSATLLDFSVPVHEMLMLPMAQVPAEQKEIREKIDDLIEGKSYRQLTMDFKTVEKQPRTHHPRKPMSVDEELEARREAANARYDAVIGGLLELAHDRLDLDGEADKRKPKELEDAWLIYRDADPKKVPAKSAKGTK